MKNMKCLFLAIAVLTAVIAAGCAANKATRATMSAEEFIKLCETGTPEQVQAAIDAGADVNAKAEDGGTALMAALYAAVFDQNHETFDLLLKAGADVNAKAEDGMTALLIAARDLDNPEVVSALLEAGAEVNVKDKDGWTALMYAAMNDQNAGVIDLLLKAGAEVNAGDKDGTTALMLAVSAGEVRHFNLECVSALLKAGIDVNAKDKDGKTALDYARKHDNTEVIAILEKAGAK